MKKDYPLLKMFVGYGVLLAGLMFTVKYAFKYLFQDEKKKQDEAIQQIAKSSNLTEEQKNQYLNYAKRLAEAFRTNRSWLDLEYYWFDDDELAIKTLNELRNKWEFEQVEKFYYSITIKKIAGIVVQENRELQEDIRKNLNKSQLKRIPDFILK